MAETRVMYGDGVTQKRLIPAPLININKTYQTSADGTIIGKTYTINVIGTIVAHMGSPLSDGSWWTAGGYPSDEDIAAESRLKAVMRKQQAIRQLFQLQGGLFEIQSADVFTPLKFYPRVVSIDFPEDIWYERSNYTITLQCEEIYGINDSDEFVEYIESATEEWSIDTNEEPQAVGASTTYTVTHSVGAVGKTFYDDSGQVFRPWQYAEKYVLPRLGFDRVMAISSGVNNLPSYYNGWNHRRSNQVDKKGGGYSVTESWLMASGSAIEEFEISTNAALDTPRNRVSIQGSVTGFELRDSDDISEITQTKWANAQTKFTWASGIAYIRAQQYSGLTNLNIEPLSMVIGRNPLQGTINYTIEYDDRPMKLIEGAKSESINIADNIGGELFASVFVLGRTRGPVLQDLGTKPANTRTLTVEIVVNPPTFIDRTVGTMQQLMWNQKPSNNAQFSTNLNNLITAADPTSIGATTVFQDQPQENWDFIEGRYSYTCTWTYE
jgi:hypothetical protein